MVPADTRRLVRLGTEAHRNPAWLLEFGLLDTLGLGQEAMHINGKLSLQSSESTMSDVNCCLLHPHTQAREARCNDGTAHGG